MVLPACLSLSAPFGGVMQKPPNIAATGTNARRIAEVK